ncbi:YodC family protein [Bradyrhizobium manausense]
MELKAGDIVMLKSGGQPLTVAEVKGEDVLCLWMGMEGDLFRETLPLATLIQVEEDHDDENEEDEEEDDE